jgi:hypothetical protein
MFKHNFFVFLKFKVYLHSFNAFAPERLFLELQISHP